MCEALFNDRRVIIFAILCWTILSICTFVGIMLNDNSAFMLMGPNKRTMLFGVLLDSWFKWWAVAVYTFLSTSIAAFSSDSIEPFITNTIQDHKTMYIPYSKYMCLFIIQVWSTYAVIMGTIGLFVALTQVDFLLIRLVADLIVNQTTTAYFLRGKIVDAELYQLWESSQMHKYCDSDISVHMPGDDGEVQMNIIREDDKSSLLVRAENINPGMKTPTLFPHSEPF